MGDGLYWIDPDGAGGSTAFQVFCDMTTAGGGWTRITGDLIKTRGWITFSRVAGTGAWQGAWHDASSFVYGPTVSAAATVRADVSLPFSFTQVHGDFAAAATTTAWHADENSVRSSWGGAPEGCEGWVTFGVPSQLMKTGGDWGGNFNQSGVSKQWTQPVTVVAATSVLRWENGQSCSPDERVLIQNIVLFVRKPPVEGTGPKGSLDNPALHCKEILESGDSQGDGSYWIDPDGAGGSSAFLVTCDMTNDGGGWTRFPGDLLRTRGLVTFSKIAGTATTAGEWTNSTTLVLGPTTSEPGAERANALMPFAFTGIRATWTGGALASNWNTDDNTARSGWGGAPTGCEGWLTFGTATLLHKKGGEWGTNYNQNGATGVWNMPATTVPSCQVVRWENGQACSTVEQSTVSAIEVWIRP